MANTTLPPLADRAAAALKEAGAWQWRLNPDSPPDDPSFVWVGCRSQTDADWAMLWQAFGVSRGTPGGWKVPCLACYLHGDGYADYVAGIDRCDEGWPSRDCGRER